LVGGKQEEVKRAGFAFIEIILVLVIIYLIANLAVNVYFKKPIIVNKEEAKVLTQEGIDTTNYQTIVSSVKEKVQGIQDQYMQEMEKIAD